MTRPTSEFLWTPDALSGRAVWVKWVGAPWNYTLDWGDGTSVDVGYWQPPIKHAYAKSGTYTVTATPHLPGGVATRAQVTLRERRAPQANFEQVPGTSRVRAHLEAVADPVRYEITWRPGQVTVHGAGDLAPEHEYPWNFGETRPLVLDAPARRAAEFTGPIIGPDPSPALSVRGFFVRYLYERTDGWEYEVLGGGLEPGAEVWFYPTRSWASGVQLYADDSGGLRHPFTHFKANLGHEFDDTWKSYTIWTSKRGYEFLHLHPVLDAKGEPQVTYTVSTTNALDMEITTSAQQLGTHWINFGDGAEVRVEVKELPFRVTHNYGYARPTSPITVWFPDGRKAQRSVESPDPCSPCFNPYYPGECTIIWYRHAAGHGCEAPCGGDAEAFAPVYISNGGTHVPHVLHKPNNDTGWGTGWAYSGFPPGWYGFRYLSFNWDRTKGVDIPKTRRSAQRPDSWVIVEDDDPEPPPLPTQTFHVGGLHEGWYDGHFLVKNAEDVPAPFALELTLDGAVLKDVSSWNGTASKTDLGGGRWRIDNTEPVPAAGSVQIGIEVNPCGRPRVWPTDVEVVRP